MAISPIKINDGSAYVFSDAIYLLCTSTKRYGGQEVTKWLHSSKAMVMYRYDNRTQQSVAYLCLFAF